ncbi:MAG: globin domain-containing protein [Pseudomonadota bacterium]|nr:globin domain-containing protein [Pseudomonadota bacterium]
MSSDLPPGAAETLRATAPLIQARGLDVARETYRRLLRDPEARALFDPSHLRGAKPAQPSALALALQALAEEARDPDRLRRSAQRIAERHAGHMVRPEHYPQVAAALMRALERVFAEAPDGAVPPGALAAWSAAYWHFADALMAREAEIGARHATEAGGWAGWRPFRIARIRDESLTIRSLVLEPADGRPVARHRPGQHLNLLFDLGSGGAREVGGAGDGRVGPLARRSYSISSAPDGRSYRITLRRQAGGAVSGWAHERARIGDVVRATPPAGAFHLDEGGRAPAVLLSGGVGLTPMVAMLEFIATAAPERRAQFVHGAENGATHAMGPHVRALCRAMGARCDVFYRAPGPGDVAGIDYDHRGLIGPDWLKVHTPLGEARYFLCGPRPFLRAMLRGLLALGVERERIAYELFGPADEALPI